MPRLRFALLALLAPLPLAAQSNAERILNDWYTRSHDYNLVHQTIRVGDFDWDSTSFRGSVATTLVSLRAGLDSVILDAGALLGVERIAAGREALRWSRHGDTLAVRLARPAGFGDTIRFTVTYAGKVKNGQGLTYIRTEGRKHRPRQIWSQGEDHDNHFWFPTYDFPNDKMTWDLIATVRAGYTAVSNGALVADTRTGATRTMHWRQAEPASTYLVSLIVAPLVRIADRWKNTPVDYYVYREDSARARPLFRVTPDMIGTYSRLTGVPYPWAKYAQTTVADFFGGMENVSATTLVDWLPDARAYADRPWYPYILIPHELAHQWFGDLVTTENWANMWLNEGFAEFMPGQYWGQKLGTHAEQDYYLDEYRQFMQINRRRQMPLASLGSNNIYPKGALVLEMLKQYLGPERFWAGLHRYLVEHRDDNATSDDLRQAFLDATGQNLDWFFDQWVYQAGYPEFQVTQSYDSAARRLTLVIRQTQTDTAKADSTGLRFTTPPVFRMPLTIRVGTASGDLVRRIHLAAREDTLTFDSLASAPSMVIFDDGNRILKTLDFDQPTGMLATQLARDPDLWNRQWVIRQLAERTTDTAAAAALQRAAAGADYYLTRAEAAEALGEFPAGLALPGIEPALRDTSARVRAAATAALGKVSGGGERALALARGAWTGDTSYAVRAAAVRAIATLDSAGRGAFLRGALATPSYNDEIQLAALGAIARGGADSALVSAVEGLMGETRNAVFVLSALSRQGNTAADAALERHRADPREYVRKWVADALAPGR